MTTVQGDAHVWNIFLPQASGSDDVRIFDWDAWRVDVATDDLAYMMRCTGFPIITGYDRRALDDDYRLSVLWQIATPVWQAANDIPSWIWWPHVERIFMAVDDLGCHDLLV
jgi:hypothetical protein